MINHPDFITRQHIRDNPTTLFLFGDNVSEAGMGGMAKEFRGEPNTHGIPTKWLPSMFDGAFFEDKDYPRICFLIAEQSQTIVKLMDGHNLQFLHIPNGIGEGLAEMDRRAPKSFAFLTHSLQYLHERYES